MINQLLKNYLKYHILDVIVLCLFGLYLMATGSDVEPFFNFAAASMLIYTLVKIYGRYTVLGKDDKPE